MQPLITPVVNAAVEKLGCILFRINKNRTLKRNGLFKNNEEESTQQSEWTGGGSPHLSLRLHSSPYLGLPASFCLSPTWPPKTVGSSFPSVYVNHPHVLLTAHRRTSLLCGIMTHDLSVRLLQGHFPFHAQPTWRSSWFPKHPLYFSGHSAFLYAQF